jgi:hypothetical protein
MKPATLARLAVSGTRTDLIRVLVTAFGAAAGTMAWLCAATVASIGVLGHHEWYSSELLNEAGLRPGVVGTFVLLTIPVLALLGQSARLGAPARDRRIAAIRLAGATPGQAVAIGAGESGVAAAIGSLIGLGAYFLVRVVLDHPNAHGIRAVPTDILPPAWSIVIICVTLPVVVTLLAARLLRRVTTSPLGVVRSERPKRAPRPWPALLIALGVAVFALYGPASRYLDRHDSPLGGRVTILLFYAGVLAATLGVALSAAWISYRIGRLMRRFGRRAPSQLAGARLLADPWQGSRTFGVLIVATLFGGGTAAVYANFVALNHVMASAQAWSDRIAGQPGPTYVDLFYTNSTRLVAIAVGVAAVMAAFGQLVSVSEAIVSRRRTYAALVATGVPRSVLVRTQMWQALAVAVPVLPVAAVIGYLIPRLVLGGSVFSGRSTMQFDNGPVYVVPNFVEHVAIPWVNLALVVGAALVAVVVTNGVGLLFLRASTRVDELRTA